MSSVEYWPRQHYGLCHQRYSHTDKDWQVLTNTEKYREIQSNIVKYWQILSNTNKYWQILSNIYVIRGILISNILVAPPPCLILIQFAHIFFADEHQENLKSINNGAECVLLGGNSWALLGFLALTLVCHKPAGLWWDLKAPLAFLSTNLKLDAEGECATESEKAWFSFDTCFLSKNSHRTSCLHCAPNMPDLSVATSLFFASLEKGREWLLCEKWSWEWTKRPCCAALLSVWCDGPVYIVTFSRRLTTGHRSCDIRPNMVKMASIVGS